MSSPGKLRETSIEKGKTSEHKTPEGGSVLEVFEISKPYAYSIIIKDRVTEELTYKVVEPTLSAKETDLLAQIRELLLETLDVTMSDFDSPNEAEKYMSERMRHIVRSHKLKVDTNSIEKINYFIVRDYVGYAKIDAMMRDAFIEDISCNGVGVPIFVWQRDYESLPTNISFNSDQELESFVVRLAYRSGRMISVARPMLDASLPDGSRIQMTLGRQVSQHGSTFTIRKFKVDPITLIDLIRLNTVSADLAAFLWFMVENKFSIFVCGGVASGKTTQLNAFSTFIKPDSKIITVEDTPEIQLYHKNWLPSVTRQSSGVSSAEISLFDLMRASLRQRPDYLIVGEVRGEETYTLFQAMATGHLGMATMHADSLKAVIHRLETEPMNIPRVMISGLNLITIQARVQRDRKPVRRTLSVSEIFGLDPVTNEILTNELFSWEPTSDSYRSVARSRLLQAYSERSGVPMIALNESIMKRETVLKWMLKKNILRFGPVTDVIRKFNSNPDAVYGSARSEL